MTLCYFEKMDASTNVFFLNTAAFEKKIILLHEKIKPRFFLVELMLQFVSWLYSHCLYKDVLG